MRCQPSAAVSAVKGSIPPAGQAWGGCMGSVSTAKLMAVRWVMGLATDQLLLETGVPIGSPNSSTPHDLDLCMAS